MPCFRGIDVSIATVQGRVSNRLPEFPHPDGSSVNLRSPGKHGSAVFHSPRCADPSSSSSEHDASRSNPKVSVYIPSVPGATFFFNYKINSPPSGQRYFYFKVFMNGRHIVSWGIDLRKVTSGEIYRALFEPSEHHHYQENGTLFKEAGIEARYFRFVPNLNPESVADDGGLVELQVFRAKARVGRAAQLDLHRNQEKYGIAILSDGLLDKPEDTSYYNYYLTDPKDAPYASFRFHYRSWKNLKQLQLIPHDEDRLSPSTSSSTVSSGASSETAHPPASVETKAFSCALSSQDQTIFDDQEQDSMSDKGKKQGGILGRFALKKPPQFPPISGPIELLPLPKNPHPSNPQPSKARRDGFSDSYLGRPLPELPDASKCTSHDTDTKSQSDRPSSSGSGVSITPSLRSHVESGRYADEVQICEAKRVVYVHDPKNPKPDGPKLVDIKRPSNNRNQQDRRRSQANSVSDYAQSMISTSGSKTSRPSPGNYLAMTGSQFEKFVSANPSPKYPASTGSRQVPGKEGDSETELPKVGTLSLKEGEWMKRPGSRALDTPSSYGPNSPPPRPYRSPEPFGVVSPPATPQRGNQQQGSP